MKGKCLKCERIVDETDYSVKHRMCYRCYAETIITKLDAIKSLLYDMRL